MLRWILKRINRWWLNHYWGEQCEEFEPGCCLCEAWLCHYYLYDDKIVRWVGGIETGRWTLTNKPSETGTWAYDFIEHEWGDVLRGLAEMEEDKK